MFRYKKIIYKEYHFFKSLTINTNAMILIYLEEKYNFYSLPMDEINEIKQIEHAKTTENVAKSENCVLCLCYPSIFCHGIEMALFGEQVAWRVKFHYFTSIEHHDP